MWSFVIIVSMLTAAAILITAIDDEALEDEPNKADDKRAVKGTLAELAGDLASGKLRKIIPDDALNLILNTCKTKRDCKDQRKEAKELKKELKKLRKEERLRLHGDDKRADAEADEQIEKTRLAKLAVFASVGLTPDLVQPDDNGLWQGHIALSIAQADSLIEMAKNAPVVPVEPIFGGVGKRRKRLGQFFQTMPKFKWPLPVPFNFDASVTDAQKATVREAVREIESKSCVRFQELPTASGPHIQYISYGTASFCGQSYIGMQPTVNPVYINFGCTTTVGNIIHETMHSLGFEHQQNRADRDNFVTIQWQNIDPQSYDFFHIANTDQFSSFGTPYDYFSVMHYEALVGSTNGQPTIVPKQQPVAYFQGKLGNRPHMSSRDAETLNKMYCKPDCQDNDVHCGFWASGGYCDASKGSFDGMEQTCKQSCYFC